MDKLITLKDLRDKLNSFDDKFLDARVVVDTEAQTFDAHLIEVKGVYAEPKEQIGIEEDLIIINLNC